MAGHGEAPVEEFNVNVLHVGTIDNLPAQFLNLTNTVTLDAGVNLALDTVTGTKIGTAASQKLGFFNATPVVQQTKAGHNNWAALSDVVSALVNLGLLDTA